MITGHGFTLDLLGFLAYIARFGQQGLVGKKPKSGALGHVVHEQKEKR